MVKGIYKHKKHQGFQLGHPQFNTGRTHFKKGHNVTPTDRSYMKGENNCNWKGGDITAECLYCGESFSFIRNGKRDIRQFCSRECANNYRKKGWVIRKCLNCDGEITFRATVRDTRKFCSVKCANQFNRDTGPKGSDVWNYKDGRSYEPYCKEFIRIREKIRAKDNWHCRKCGTSQEELERTLDVHHIDGNKKNNEPENLISLCRTCHMKTETMRWKNGRKRND